MPIIENGEIDLMKLFNKIWKGRKTVLRLVIVFLLIGLFLSFANPKIYKSDVKLLVETGTSSMFSGLLRQFGGLAGLSLGNTSEKEPIHPEIYPDIVMSMPFLLELMAEEINLSDQSRMTLRDYLDTRMKNSVTGFIKSYTIELPWKIAGWLQKNPEGVITERVSDYSKPLVLSWDDYELARDLSGNISFSEGETEEVFTISVFTQDPLVSAEVANLIAKKLSAYILDYRTQKAREDMLFIEARFDEARQKYAEAQHKLAAYLDKNKNIILQSVQVEQQNLQSEYNLNFEIYSTLAQQLEQSRLKIQEKTPVFKTIDPAKVPVKKIKPKRSLIMTGMLLLGIIAGSALVLFRQDESTTQT
jgi:uncharacterized protein involved in exopolysaccharide biosynthesis